MGRRGVRIEWWGVLALLLGWMLGQQIAWGDEPDWARIEQVLMAEAASEGELGMTWVACVMRERGGDLDAFSGHRRRDLEGFARRQPRHTVLAAHAAVQSARRGFDCGGASHFENVGAFGVPAWARGLTPVATVGRHTFWRIRF